MSQPVPIPAMQAWREMTEADQAWLAARLDRLEAKGANKAVLDKAVADAWAVCEQKRAAFTAALEVWETAA